MEIYGRAINSQTGEPVPFATVQRLYPDGQNYSAPVIADENGYFNGRVPDKTYKWNVTSAGYNPILVTLENAVHDIGLQNNSTPTTQPLLVTMISNGTLPEVVVTPGLKKTAWITGLALLLVVGYIAKEEKLIKI